MSMAYALKFEGVYTALVTPFTETGEVDWDTYTALVERQAVAGVAGVVPVGTTGESPTLSLEEKRRLISIAVQIAGGRMQVIAGTGKSRPRCTQTQQRAAATM